MAVISMAQRSIKLALAFIFACNIAHATDYYVKTTGSDSDTGLDLGHGFLTIQKGFDSITNPGDRVLVDDGTYPDPVAISGKSGSAESPKTITAITQANPCVITSVAHGYSNGDKIQILGVTNYKTTGMQQLFNKFFKVANKTNDTFELTYIDGTNVDSRSYDPYVGSGTVTRILPIEIKAINRGLAVIDSSETVSGWVSSGANYVSDAVTLNSGASSAILWRTDQNRGASGYKSSCGSISTEGDYCYDSATLKFTLRTSVNPTLYTYKGFRRGNQSNIVIRSGAYILIDGIKTQFGSDPIVSLSTLGETNNIVFDYVTTSKTVYHGGIYILGGDTYQMRNIVIDHSTIEYQDDNGTGIDSNGHGLKITGNSNTSDVEYITVSNSTIHDTRQHGIQFSNGTTSGYFYGNRIYGFSLMSSGSSAGIRTGLGETNHLTNKDTQIFDNNIGGGSGDTGYSLGCSIFVQDDNRGTTVFRNRIHHNTWHGIYVFYTAGAQAPSNFLGFNNLIYENKTAGIRADNSHYNPNGNNKFYNNTLYENGESPISGVGAAISLPQSLSNGWGIYNNIISTRNAYQIYSSTSGHIYPSNFNLFYSTVQIKFYFNGTTYNSLAEWNAATTGVTAEGLDDDSVTGDPLFAAPGAYDFLIPSPDTPADVAGTNLSSTFNTDYALETRQTPWDIGAYNTRGNLVVHTAVTPNSLFPSKAVSATVQFSTTEINIPSDGKIKITYPTGFTLNSGGTTGVTSVVGINGTFSVGVSGQTVTITRNGDGTETAPNDFSLVNTFIQNPSTSGLTNVFEIVITDASNVEIGSNHNVPGVVISDISPRTINGAVFQGGIFN